MPEKRPAERRTGRELAQSEPNRWCGSTRHTSPVSPGKVDGDRDLSNTHKIRLNTATHHCSLVILLKDERF